MIRSRRENACLILLLGALSVVTPFAVDMYLPAFPRLAAEFHTTTSVIAWSLSTYFIGFALGQILYGPLLDRFGRKKPIYVGLSLYILASLGCMQPHNIRNLMILRLLQAIGGCVAQVGSIAMVRDFFPAHESARIFSLLFLIIGVSPLLAPTVGSIIIVWFGWQWIFALLASIAALTLASVFYLLPDGYASDRSVSLKPGPILRSFVFIFRQRQFLTYALAGAFSFAGLFAYVAGSPLIFMDGFHVSAKTFGLIFATLTMGFIGGNQLNVLLLRKLNSQRIFLLALLVQVIIGTVFLIGTVNRWFAMAPTLVLFFLFLLCIGLTYPNAAAIALAPFSKNVGSASALLGFLQMGVGALISTGIGFFGSNSIVGLLAGSALISLLILLVGRQFTGSLVEQDSEAVAVLH